MNSLKEFLTPLNHHAYCLETGGADMTESLSGILSENFGIKTHGNPDFWVLEKENLGIDESRALKERSAMVPVYGKKIILVSFANATREAQNSLLKLFEDPTPNTHFFLLVSDSSNLLPTLLSRLQIFKIPEIAKGEDEQIFLKKDIAERMKIVEKLVSDFKEEKIEKSTIKTFLNNIEREVHTQIKKGKRDELKKAGEEIIKMRSFVGIPSASVKMILENLALSLPVI